MRLLGIYHQPCSALLVAFALSCASENVQLNVELGPGFVREHRTVSVFGVYKDGQMDVGYWHQIAPQLAGALGQTSCEGIFTERPRDLDEDLYDRTQRDARDDGVSADLVSRFADLAKGDLVLVLYVSGRLPSKTSAASNAPLAVSSMGRGRGSRGFRPRPGPPPDDNALTLAWSLYSTRSHERVAESTLRYTGQSSDEAMNVFLDKLRGSLVDPVCAGWKWPEEPGTTAREGVESDPG